MAPGDDWDAEKMLQVYILDYMKKKNLHAAADIFAAETNVGSHPAAIESAGGFLAEWWSLFYDLFASRQGVGDQGTSQQEDKGEGFGLETQTTENDLQSLLSVVPNFETILATPELLAILKNMLGEQLSSLLAAKMSLQQQISRQPPQWVQRDIIQGINTGRATSMDQTLYGVAIPRAGPLDAEPETFRSRVPASLSGRIKRMFLSASFIDMNKGVDPMPLEGHTSSEFDQFLSSFSQEGLTPELQLPIEKTQFQLPSAPYQQDPILSYPTTLLGVDQVPFALDNQVCNNAEKGWPIDENIENFLSADDVNANAMPTPSSILKQDSSHYTINGDKGFSFKEVGRLQAKKGKVFCCHFSTDGKMLVGSGHDKKFMIWNMETYDYVCTSEQHSLPIKDVRFEPNSYLFASPSFDRSVQIWDANKPGNALRKLHGHVEQVISVDFHPRKLGLLCSCDISNAIRLWNVEQQVCICTTKGATKQVRFQPGVGKLLATALGNGVNIIDVETGAIQAHLKGHVKDVRAICWDTSGKYLASISEDSARVWSPTMSGICVHELLSTGHNFQSCTFHPGYSLLLAIGGYQTLELWDPSEGIKTMSIPAHAGLIAALADSPQTEIIASASHDQCVKLWK